MEGFSITSHRLYSTQSEVKELASGMRQLAGTKTRYRRAHAAPLAGLIFGSIETCRIAARNSSRHQAMQTSRRALCIDDLQRFRDRGDEANQLGRRATKGRCRTLDVELFGIDRIKCFGQHYWKIIVTLVAGDLLISAARLPQRRWIHFGVPDGANANRQQQPQTRDRNLAVLFLTAALGSK